jgi:hypothetical protein
MPIFNQSVEKQIAAVRESLSELIHEGEVLRNFTMAYKVNWIGSVILFVPLLLIQFVLLLISLILKMDEPLLFLGWPERLKFYNKYVIGVTNHGMFSVRLWGLAKFGYTCGKMKRIGFYDIDHSSIQVKSNTGWLTVKHRKGKINFKIKGQHWITRSKQISSMINAMQYY